MLRTRPEAAATAILGSSLGGLISAWAGVHDAASFGLVGALSPSTWWNSGVVIEKVQAMGVVRPQRVYVDNGASGDDGDNTNRLAEAFAGDGYIDGQTLSHVVDPAGQHDESSWARRLPGALTFLFGRRP
jgi:predicted alpha/beta superfamily hydrolase